MGDYLQVTTTASSSDEAARLARAVTEARLAACVQILGPIRSVYWWDGEVQDEQEWQLVMKTTADALPALESHIKANHSYDVPEIVATPIVGGSAEYLAWVSAETGSGRA
ncbi:divalent-cation tolerance protein CutA [Thermoactinospora rubra]|uniref:divalent-cation tolerance protein CutA n=1 Tax=Thermoactinospora rubra TaxID=1088767 RepID=UPI000A12042D|nr:divalent-cation tolerance protein CutA [Thermoactinospora rubra]